MKKELIKRSAIKSVKIGDIIDGEMEAMNGSFRGIWKVLEKIEGEPNKFWCKLVSKKNQYITCTSEGKGDWFLSTRCVIKRDGKNVVEYIPKNVQEKLAIFLERSGACTKHIKRFTRKGLSPKAASTLALKEGRNDYYVLVARRPEFKAYRLDAKLVRKLKDEYGKTH